MMMGYRLVVTFLPFLGCVDAFISTRQLSSALHRMARSTTVRAAPTASALQPSISAELQSSLNNVPLFAVGNEEGKPLQYQVAGKPMAIFYADVAAAKKQLTAALDQNPNYDLVPVGLGSAVKLSCDGKAMVVPGLAELVAAGAPEDAQPMGQELPLFGCMEMARQNEDGTAFVPLFLSHSDCAAAVKEASEPGPIVPLSLQGTLDQLNDPASGSFTFEPPSASIIHVESYVGKGIYWREAEPAGPAE